MHINAIYYVNNIRNTIGLSIPEKHDTIVKGYHSNGIHVYVTKVGDKYLVHNYDGPAYCKPNHVCFYYYGHNVTIEELSCEPILKVALLLKYTKSISMSTHRIVYDKPVDS